MAIAQYFAMTAAEIRANGPLPSGLAWMACHFSPYGTGLSNLPNALPPDSLLILNDRTPIHGHDPARIARQLEERITALSCQGLLLDFQRPGEPETAALVRYLTDTLPCPVIISDKYGDGLDCPVFLPPVPPDTALSAHLAPWQGRKLWLDITLEGIALTLTKEGACAVPLPRPFPVTKGRREETLHCHYRIDLPDSAAKFTLWRTAADLEELLEEAERLGVTAAVGLYQEFHALRKSGKGTSDPDAAEDSS